MVLSVGCTPCRKLILKQATSNLEFPSLVLWELGLMLLNPRFGQASVVLGPQVGKVKGLGFRAPKTRLNGQKNIFYLMLDPLYYRGPQ